MTFMQTKKGGINPPTFFCFAFLSTLIRTLREVHFNSYRIVRMSTSVTSVIRTAVSANSRLELTVVTETLCSINTEGICASGLILIIQSSA